MTDVPRHAQLDLQTPAEAAIRAAIDAVEMAGCSVHLTAALVLLGRARERVADFVDGVPVKPPSRHEDTCPCYPDCADATCQGCECGAADIATLQASLAAADGTRKRIAQESEERLARIGELEVQASELHRKVAMADATIRMMADTARSKGDINAKLERELQQVRVSLGVATGVAHNLCAERDQSNALAREWREKAERLKEQGSPAIVELIGYRASATALAKFLEEFSGGEMDPSPAMAAASAISYIRHIAARPMVDSRHLHNGPEQPLTDRTF